MAHVFFGVLDHGDAEQHVGFFEKQLCRLRQKLGETTHAVEMQGGRAGMLAETDGDHLDQSALMFRAEIGVWLDAVAHDDVVGLVGVFVAKDWHIEIDPPKLDHIE